MSQVLVDANVLLDVLTEDPHWFDWSGKALEEQAAKARLCINPLIYAEVSVGFERIEELDEALPASDFTRLPLPWEAGFLAGKAFLRYRRDGGQRRSPLPDFIIGAHAAVSGLPLITRDVRRYRTYFPKLLLICPGQA
ncbi:MAG: type II toxin-antitoxin system VapC family toxin [Pseudomonas sp.]